MKTVEGRDIQDQNPYTLTTILHHRQPCCNGLTRGVID